MYVYNDTCIFASDDDFRTAQRADSNEVEFIDREYKCVYKKREKTIDVSKNGEHLYKTWCVISHISGRAHSKALDNADIDTQFIRLDNDDYKDKLEYINSH